MIARYRRKPVPPGLLHIVEFSLVLLGSYFVAVAFNVFLLPHDVASGGVAGISTITRSLFGWEPSIVQAMLNVPLFIAGVVILGKNFGIKTLVGTIALPFFVFLTKDYPVVTPNPLLGAIFGGMGVGLGLGIVFRGKASTGGIDLAAQILHKYFPLPLGVCVALFDGMIVITAAFVFSIEAGLYALIGLFITSRTIDFVQVGLNTSKNILIISDKMEEVRTALLSDIDRGVTVINGTGGYTDEERKIIMCVVAQNEFIKLTQTIKNIDPQAFVIVMNATEVLGEGFKSHH
ncbi:YitT family protein [Aquibacillus sp. 3ASR75-11]|uniref:YitT family protein n=1 Tax=Terrihalobacillus insolitus TaxID=2950438 RepID=A0A9X3WTI7_9BACI|nr:YitT family protein [Terrihalobacillus insolitus]MDC3412242.1 YitT family protein [Terrihalobacillus insolitus]MDC3423064.1 YitT family protein [Terrihalobacillus insolitus]